MFYNLSLCKLHFYSLWSFGCTACLGGKQAGTSSSLDLLLSELGEVLSLDDNRDSDLSISKKLEVSLGDKVNNRGLSGSSRLGSLVYTLPSNVEELVKVEGGSVGPVLQNMELTHTNFTEVTRVILVEEDTVMVLSSGVTATTRMLTVLSDTTVSHGDVAALFACFVETGRHDGI